MNEQHTEQQPLAGNSSRAEAHLLLLEFTSHLSNTSTELFVWPRPQRCCNILQSTCFHLHTKVVDALRVFTSDKQVLFTATVSAACLCVLDYCGNACDMTDWKVWRAQTVKSPLAPAYKRRGRALFFLRGRVYGWKGQDG